MLINIFLLTFEFIIYNLVFRLAVSDGREDLPSIFLYVLEKFAFLDNCGVRNNFCVPRLNGQGILGNTRVFFFFCVVLRKFYFFYLEQKNRNLLFFK